MRAVRRADNLATFMLRLSRNTGSLHLLEPEGSVQACSGIFLLYKTVTMPLLCKSAVDEKTEAFFLIFLIFDIQKCRNTQSSNKKY
jgi:hypothetical protein